MEERRVARRAGVRRLGAPRVGFRERGARRVVDRALGAAFRGAWRARDLRALARRFPAAVAAEVLTRERFAVGLAGSCYDAVRSHPAGHSTSPRICTSGSSTTPNA